MMVLTHKQKEIIEASGRVITQKGFSALTVKNLAIEMGFVESALYRHFHSKEDLIIMLIKFLQSNMEERFEPILKSDLTDLDKIKYIFESQFSYISEHPYFLIAILSEGIPDDSPQIRESLLNLLSYKMDVINNLFHNLVHAGERQSAINVANLVLFLMGGFRILLLKWKLTEFSFDLKKEGNELIHSFFQIIKISNEG